MTFVSDDWPAATCPATWAPAGLAPRSTSTSPARASTPATS